MALLGVRLAGTFSEARAAALPKLSATQIDPQQIRLSWPSDASAFVLESATSIGAASTWIQVSAPRQTDAAGFFVTVSPAGGNRFFRLRESQGNQLTRIVESSPAAGENGVSVTRETVVRLSGPLAATVTIPNDKFYAEFGGRKLLTRVQISGDRRTLTLFYLEPLPGSARVRVTLKGDGLNDEAGRAVDVDGDGQPGGTALIDFETLSTTAAPNTAVCGRVFASELASGPNGQSVNVPLAGVIVTVDGKEDSLRAVTDQNGDFRLEPVPSGDFFVHIDGRKAERTAQNDFPRGAYYPFVGKKWTAVAGEEVNIGDIFLPLIVEGTLKPVNANQATVVTFPAEVLAKHPELGGVTLTVPPNALLSENGLHGGMVGIAPVAPDRLPSPLPPGLNFPLVITIQTDGPSNFDVPVPVCFPNLPDPETGEAKAPGTQSALWSFNHDLGDWEVVGSMTVSADGKLVCTDPGVGIRQPGWHSDGPGTQGSGGNTRNGRPRNPTRPRPTGDQECAHNDCPCEGNCHTGREVFLQSGEEVMTLSDLVIPGRAGLDFRMERTYRSRLDYNGPLGFGWNFRYNESLFIEPNGDVVRYTGRSHEGTWTRNADGTFTPPAGYFGYLSRTEDGLYMLVDTDGFQRIYREDGLVICHQDRFNNRMLFDYDDRGNLHRVIDVYGREIQFTFQTFPDGIDRIVKVEDFTGRQVRYEYDNHGDLVSVTTPAVTGTSTGNNFPQGRTERYAYSSGFAQPELNHNLLSVTAPEEVAHPGPPKLLWTYGTDPANPMLLDRVLSETEGGTNASGIAAGGTRRFEYAMLNENAPAGQLELPRGRARITERNGNVQEYFVNERMYHIITREFTKGLRAGEPQFFETRSFYDDDGQLVRKIFPQGNEIRYTYDTAGPRRSRANLIEVRRVADSARGGGNDLVTTFTYEPLFNQVLTMTEPRGNDPSYQPALGQAGAGRYTKRFYYDYQESTGPVPLARLLGVDLSSIPRGLGDLNGDGRTDQLFGNLVQVQAPDVLLRADANEAKRRGGVVQKIISQTQYNDNGQIIARVDPEGIVTEFKYYPEDDPDGDNTRTFAAYTALSAKAAGYLQSTIVDSKPSSRRSPDAPAPVAIATTYRYDQVGNVVGILNGRGVLTRLEVNALNEIVAVTSGAEVSAAAQSKQLVTGEPAFQYQTRFQYDANGRIVRKEIENRDGITSGVGNYVDQTFEFDILNNLLNRRVEIDGSRTLLTQSRYDPDELLASLVQPEGNSVRIAYDERNMIYEITRGAGSAETSSSRFDYDLNGNLRRVLDAQDNDGDGQPEAALYAYDGFDRRTDEVDPLGNKRTAFFDPASNKVRELFTGHPAGKPGTAPVRLRETRKFFDELGRPYQTDEAVFVADGFSPSRPVQVLDGDGDGFVTTFQEFDALSRLTYVVEDDKEVHQIVYDGAGRRVQNVDALGNSTAIQYDQNSNPLRVTRREVSPENLVPAESFTTLYVYDQLDRVVRASDNAGHTMRFGYDSRDNLISQSDPEGPLIADPLGLVPANFNAPGNSASYAYDGLGRLIRSTGDLRQGGTGNGALDTSNPFNPDGQVTVSFEWDGNSRLVGVRDDNGRLTAYTYDALDRRTSQKQADGTSYSYLYDRDDNLVQVTDPNGTVIKRTYDAINRPVRTEVLQAAAGIAGSKTVTFEYDGLSRLTRSADDNGDPARTQISERVYDSLSRLVEERQNGRAVSSTYSGDGKRLASIYPGGRRIDRTFDALDRVQKEMDGAAAVAEFRWIGPQNRELLRLHGNQAVLSYLDAAGKQDTGYDATQRPIHQRLLAGGNAVLDREYGYNRADQRTFERRNDDAKLADIYQYDSLYRVFRTELDVEGTPAAVTRSLETITYALDGAGNRRELNLAAGSQTPASTRYSVNEVNEYTTVGAGARSYSKNGNLLDDGQRTFTYDFQDRLVAVRRKPDQALVAEYLYDAENRRREKIVYSASNPGSVSTRTLFFYEEGGVCEEQNGAGQTEITYVSAPGYVDAHLQMRREAAHPLGAGVFYLHQNARYDVVAVTDASGAVAERRIYDDYGNAFSPDKQPAGSSSVANPYGFQGQRSDPETGLYYFKNRYYDPATGRFLQRDHGWDAANFANQYTFAGNNPASALDPSGLNSKSGRSAARTQTRPPPPSPTQPGLSNDPVIETVGGVSRALNAAGTLGRTQQALDAIKTAEAAEEYTRLYNQMHFLENMSNLNHAGPDVSNLYHTATKVEQLEKTVQAAGGVEQAAKAGKAAKAMKAAGYVGNALQVAEVAANAVDYYAKDERVKRLASSERDRILAEYDRLVREALQMSNNPCLRDKLLKDLRENMEYQLNNVTDGQITEHLINGAVFLRDSLATFIPLPTGWLWGNKTEEAGRPK